MKYRDEKHVRADEGVTVDLTPAGLGRCHADLYYTRTLRNGDVEQVRLTLPGIDRHELACIARSIRKVMDSWSNDWHRLDAEMRGDA